MSADYDVLVVGSGFGGSVAALRLTEKGYRVGVLEAGRRFGPDDFPRTSWRVRRFLWAPRMGCHGIQRLTFLRHALVLSGAGVGGGSLVYANVLYRPRDADPGLEPYYELAARMLGATRTPFATPADEVVRRVAERMGAGETHRPTDVGVYFGPDGPDPYFGGAGPARRGCVRCGGCMVGCRHLAKNTLDLNYLWLAEQGGAEIRPEHEAVAVRRLPEGWEVVTRRPGPLPRRERRLRAGQVVLAAGVLGTLRLLFGLSDPPPLLGHGVRTNSETLVGATAVTDETDYSRGVAIGSLFEPEPGTVLQPVRYPRGSSSMALLARPLQLRRWAERTVVLLCMGAGEDALRLEWRGGRLRSSLEGGVPPPARIDAATEAARLAAELIGGRAGRFRLNRPITAHILGGACVGDTPATGVVDRHHRVFGQPGLHVVDGSTVGANLGVNPALTIAAQAERAMAGWPANGAPDERPPPS